MELTIGTPNWQSRGNCVGVDPDRMQPEVATLEEVEDAKAVCVGCPVAAECLDLARSQPGAYGVHAGQWFGPPAKLPKVDRPEDAELFGLFAEGWSIRKVAAEYGMTVKTVRLVRERWVAA